MPVLLATPMVNTGRLPEKTPYTSIEDKDLEAFSHKADFQPLRYLKSYLDIEDVLRRIHLARQEGADWEDAEGCPVPYAAEKSATDLVNDLARSTEADGVQWQSPSASATPDGGIHLSWRVNGCWITLTIFAPHNDVICVTMGRDEKPCRELMSIWTATSRVAAFFREAMPDEATQHAA